MINIYPFINDIWGLNTVTTADAEHAWEAISDVSNVGLLNWELQSLTDVKGVPNH